MTRAVATGSVRRLAPVARAASWSLASKIKFRRASSFVLSSLARPSLSSSYLMYWESHLNPSPYPIRRTTEHMNTSMGRMLRDSRCTFPLPVV